MTGQSLRQAREQAGWPQVRLADSLGVTQAYLSLMEGGKRPIPDRVARLVARVLELPPTALPFTDSRPANTLLESELADELAALGYPGLAYRRKRRPKQNPAELLLRALASDALESRLTEALPWLFLRFEGLDGDHVLRRAKADDLQNRLGFVLSLAREVAEHHPAYRGRVEALRAFERRIEPSRLVREGTFGQSELSEQMRAWLRNNRSSAAEHWNLLTDLKRKHLPYANDDPGPVA